MIKEVFPGVNRIDDHVDPRDSVFFPTHYTRLVFTFYWNDSPPSTEIFFKRIDKSYFHMNDIRFEEAQVLALAQSMEASKMGRQSAGPKQVIFVASSFVRMSSEDIMAAGWHVIK